MTLEQIGAALGLTKQRVSQLEGRALRKVAIALQERGLGPDDLLADGRRDLGMALRKVHRSD